MVEQVQPPVHSVVLDAAGQDMLDFTSAEVLKGLVNELHNKDIAVFTAEAHAPAREFGERSGLLSIIGKDRTFPTVESAVRSIEASN